MVRSAFETRQGPFLVSEEPSRLDLGLLTTVGVLALQGGFEAHLQALARAGADAREVRRVAGLADVQGLIVPGGESTTLLNLMQDEPWFAAIRAFHERGGSLFGTCAGAILLAREVRGPAQPSLALLDVIAERNAYGRQVDSFETLLHAPALGGLVTGVFIRAPRLLDPGPGVEVIASRQGEPVLVRQDRVWAATFHPELTTDPRVHRAFVESVARTRAA